MLFILYLYTFLHFWWGHLPAWEKYMICNFTMMGVYQFVYLILEIFLHHWSTSRIFVNTFHILIHSTFPSLRSPRHGIYFFFQHYIFSRCIVVPMQYTTSRTWARNVLRYYNQVKLHCIFKLGWFWLYVALPKSTQRHVRSVVQKFKKEHFGRSRNLKLWHTKYPM